MADFYSFPLHEVLKRLRDNRGHHDEPFSQSRWLHDVGSIDAVAELAEKLRWALTHGRDMTEVTDEELKVLRDIAYRLKELQKRDIELRWKQDLILQCLHPDGCYRGYLDNEVVLEAYGIIPVDPVQGIKGIPLGWPSDKLDELHEFLKKKVAELHRKYW